MLAPDAPDGLLEAAFAESPVAMSLTRADDATFLVVNDAWFSRWTTRVP